MTDFKPNTPITTTDAAIEVTVDPANPLPVGLYRFQLVVVDDGGNASDPAFVEVLVKDTQKPTAVLDAPSQVELGQTFKLSGERSADAPPGKILQYVWTLIPNPDRPQIPPIIRPPIEGPATPFPPILNVPIPVNPLQPLNPPQ